MDFWYQLSVGWNRPQDLSFLQTDKHACLTVGNHQIPAIAADLDFSAAVFWFDFEYQLALDQIPQIDHVVDTNQRFGFG